MCFWGFVDRTEFSSVLFELCIFFQTKNRTSDECLNISFLSSEIKNVTVSLRTSATNWMNISYVKRWVVDKPIKSSFETLLEGTWKDAEKEIKQMGRNKVEAPSGRM